MKKVPFSGRPPSSLTPAADAWVAEQTALVPLEPTKRFTFDVPLSLHKRIKTCCVQDDRLMADVLRELLEREFPASL